MSIFLYILSHNIAPVFIIILLGFAVSRKFNLNIGTMSKLNFYLFVPSFIFVNLYQADLDISMLKVIVFCAIYLVVGDLLGRAVAKLRGFDTGLANAFKNSIMFNNTGNIGLSLITLVFSSGPFLADEKTPWLNQALAVIITILVFMNIATNTLGMVNAGSAGTSLRDSIIRILLMPIVYIIPLALLLKGIHFDMKATFLWPALVYLKDGLVPIALLTLGVQLSKTKIDFRDVNVHISVFIRLVFGPVLAMLLIFAFGFTGVTAQTILIAYSVPTAVNTALIAVECRNNESFATQAVVASTVFSTVTLTLVIYLARIIYPV